jgi:outer membrane protein OmpA-like peptidoglycan-associated protein/ABC-type nitrate/sulfonate/bicarbonate transport system substrate-binding protein
MAKLTPLAKGLIAIAIVGGTSAAAWKLGLRDILQGKLADSGDEGSTDPSQDQNARTPPAAPAGGPVGTSGSPLKVSIVSFHGYAPALVANGSSLKTQPGSIFAKKGVNVEFVIQDDIPTLATIFTSGAAQCAWRTSDFWAQEQPNLRSAGLDARAVLVVDNTQGADAIIARDPAVQRVEDLADKKLALLQYTPSHGMAIDAIDNSSLSARKKTSVEYVFINADEGTAGVRAAFAGGQVDAAALWDPDLSLALKAVPGAHVVYSTKTATNLIYDVIVCDKRVLDNAANEAAIQAFVAGWLEGVDVAEKNPQGAVDALVKTEEFFTLLTKEQGRAFTLGLFKNLVWTGLEDNLRILGLVGGTNHYERVYKRFDSIYRAAGALANPNAPVINPSDSFDYRFVKALMAEAPKAQEEAKKPEFTFTATESAQAAKQPAIITKPVMVNFDSGKAELTKRAERTIDTDMVPLIESHGSAYFEVSGNTDSTGSRAVNQKLSLARAEAVVKYLKDQWEFDPSRFVVVGNGPDKPLCEEQKPEEGLSLEDCQARNRTTRVAVLSR